MEADYKDSEQLLSRTELRSMELEERLATCNSVEAVKDIVAEYA